ncbi:MAG: hypothetical protein SYNGOMJ08_00158 [Candidatus Syntrophoarchaeum sp. GoM_oil]|nr:MAG: hypothetical protein SYNGOMJ08_00158 [Candidatus Syntrophoarchaeum sp. GoM_oil]
MKEKIDNEKCLNCELIPCANLSLKSDELDGGELYVLNESIKQKKIVPCQPMIALYSCCMLCKTAYKRFVEENKIEEEDLMDVPPLLELIWQCIYDLKASAFLALTAHYRGAIQLLRPVIENILVGLYFEEKLQRAISEEELDQAWVDFDEWKEGYYKLNGEDLDFGNLKKWLEKNDILTEVGKEEFGKLWGKMGKEYIHPYHQRMDIGEEKCSTCPATTRYDENRYYEWLEFFQNLIDFIIEMVLCYYPTIAETADAKEALGYLKNLEGLERDLEIPMIKSKYLRDRIARLPDIENLFEVEH